MNGTSSESSSQRHDLGLHSFMTAVSIAGNGISSSISNLWERFCVNMTNSHVVIPKLPEISSLLTWSRHRRRGSSRAALRRTWPSCRGAASRGSASCGSTRRRKCRRWAGTCSSVTLYSLPKLFSMRTFGSNPRSTYSVTISARLSKEKGPSNGVSLLSHVHEVGASPSQSVFSGNSFFSSLSR